MARNVGKKLTILVSSTVYGHEDLLELIYVTLTSFGYEVWMSHAGTVQVYSTRTAFENCLDAVKQCDLFLSFITKSYGSGKADAEALSITHQELQLAIALGKPRWVLAHHDVVFARTLLRDLGYETSEKRSQLNVKKGAIIDDLRVIDVYEEATRSELKFDERSGNWVQKFKSDPDAMLFVQAQFHRYQEVESFIRENFAHISAIRQTIEEEAQQ